jgi:hypothetical protein
MGSKVEAIIQDAEVEALVTGGAIVYVHRA